MPTGTGHGHFMIDNSHWAMELCLSTLGNGIMPGRVHSPRTLSLYHQLVTQLDLRLQVMHRLTALTMSPASQSQKNHARRKKHHSEQT